MGDSYTVGLGGEGYVERTARALGWSGVAEGQSGTGYVNPSGVAGQQAYGERVDDVAAHRPDVVVVQGSTNDAGAAPPEVSAAAAQLYADLAEALPAASVVVVGPVAPPGIPVEEVRAVRDAVARAAEGAGLPFVDPVAEDWLRRPDGLFTEDGIHPNQAGYDEMAERLAAALRELVPAA
nr:SGNH/GDSL hydrolase family protein [Blastococcus saxobsidens]